MTMKSVFQVKLSHSGWLMWCIAVALVLAILLPAPVLAVSGGSVGRSTPQLPKSNELLVGLSGEQSSGQGIVGASGEGWFDASWSRRKPVTISGSLSVLSAYQVKITVPYDGDMKADFSDLRFTAGDGVTQIPFWVERVTASSSAIVWVRIPQVPTSGTTVYLYYGNPSATSLSNGPGTFEFFEDFETPFSFIWTEKQALPSGRADATAAVYNNILYLIGGYGTSPDDIRAEVYAYNPTTNAWTQKTSMPTPRWGMVAVEFNGKIYTFSGLGGESVVEVYDPATNTWSSKGSLPSGLLGQGIMGVRYNDRIHLFYQSSHYAYDPVTDTYTQMASVPTPRTWGTAAEVGGKIYIIGGYSYGNPQGATDVNEMYDPVTNTWSTKIPMPVPKYGATRENPVINGKIYVTHGLDGGFRSDNYAYDPATNTWEQKSSALFIRDGVACGIINSKLYVVGGRNNGDPFGLTTVEEYNPATDTGSLWTFSNVNKVLRSSAARYQGSYSLMINDDTTTNQYAEHTYAGSQKIAVDLAWDLTNDLGTSGGSPQTRITLADPSRETSGTLYYFNAGTPRFFWYNGTFTPLQSGNYNTWFQMSLIWNGAASRVIINGASYPVVAAAIPSDRIRVESMQLELSRTYFDLVRIRQYATPDPVPTLGLEEQRNPVPAITTLTPSSATAGGAAFTLTVDGTNFMSSSVVRWNGVDRTTTYVSATRVTASIPAGDIATAGTAQVTVFNPAPGGGTSNALTFTINPSGNPVPTLTVLNPSSATAGGAAFTLTVDGTNFMSSSVVRWNGVDRTTTYVSATRVTAAITAADIATAGTAQVTVFNPAPGGGTSNALTFTITGGGVTITLSQNFPPVGGAGRVTVAAPTGTSWTATPSASWITISAGSSGTGPGTIFYSVAPYTGSVDRTGTITVGGTAVWSITQQLLPVNPDRTAPVVSIQAPAVGEIWYANQIRQIQWTATDNVGVTSVDLAYSTNGGTSYIAIASGIANSGTYSWTVPTGISTTNARMRVIAYDAAGNSGSAAQRFTIRP